MEELEVFAEITCPFAYVGLRHILRERTQRGQEEPLLRVRAWPLELINEAPFQAAAVMEKATALRDQVAPDLFSHINPANWPTTSLPAFALTAAAYRVDAHTGEGVAMALREALFEQGKDIADSQVLAEIAAEFGVGTVSEDDVASVMADWQEGTTRGVIGSPHFFHRETNMFCPTLTITHPEGGLHIEVDTATLDKFLATVF